jgi:hypothetical protein
MTALLVGRLVLLSSLVALGMGFVWIVHRSNRHNQ